MPPDAEVNADDARKLAAEYVDKESVFHAYRLRSVTSHIRKQASKGKYGVLIEGLRDVEDIKQKLIARGFHYYHRQDGVLHVRW